MCGFFASNDPLVTPDSEAVVDKALRFRGPDSQSGLLTFAGWHVYHSRLAIIAPTDEFSQPYSCPDGSTLLFNGEIFNYRELSRQYLGQELRSDTQTLAHLLMLPSFDIAELDGFFAFVRISISGELLNCARDHFGVKPLFVYRRNGYVSISSEPKALRDIFNLGVNETALNEYRIFRGPIFSGSYFDHIDQVDAGTCEIRGRFFESKDCIASNEYDTPNIEEIRQAITESILSRHVSDVPVGLLYSGGVDSNLIDREGPQLTRYSVGFEGDYDLDYAAETEGEADTRVLRVSGPEFRQKFDDLLQLRGEPMSVPNEVMLSLVAGVAKTEGMKVLLSGEGADEFFAGYDRIYGWAARQSKFDLGAFCEHYCYSPIDADSEEFEHLADIFSGFGDLTCFELVRQFFVKYHLPLLFRRLDFALMSAGVEGREPLSSLRVFKSAMRLGPAELMGPTGLGKIPLRELLALSKGREFAFRKKVGFPVALDKVFDEYQGTGASNYDIWFAKNMEILK